MHEVFRHFVASKQTSQISIEKSKNFYKIRETPRMRIHQITCIDLI